MLLYIIALFMTITPDNQLDYRVRYILTSKIKYTCPC